jgi:hypothetical protein
MQRIFLPEVGADGSALFEVVKALLTEIYTFQTQIQIAACGPHRHASKWVIMSVSRIG